MERYICHVELNYDPGSDTVRLVLDKGVGGLDIEDTCPINDNLAVCLDRQGRIAVIEFRGAHTVLTTGLLRGIERFSAEHDVLMREFLSKRRPAR